MMMNLIQYLLATGKTVAIFITALPWGHVNMFVVLNELGGKLASGFI